MKFLFDLFPVILFFIAFKFGGIYPATAVLMAATVLQTGIVYALEKKLPAMQKATLVLILLFGALTLIYRDQRFLQWKFTILHGGFALVLAFSIGLALMEGGGPAAPTAVSLLQRADDNLYRAKSGGRNRVVGA